MTRKILLAAIIFAVLVGGLAQAAPKSKLWDKWEPSNAQSTTRVDHGPWNAFLKQYLSQHDDGVNRVAYGEVAPTARQDLDAYLRQLEATPVTGLNRSEQMAFWINLYNALTVTVILDHFPVESIRDIDISPGLFANGPWGKKLLTIENEPVSLDDIEHRILRPIWKDPRIHYAVNCASIGCPDLQTEAYTADNLERLLTQGAVDYINHSRGVELTNGKLTVSSIYKWFKSDFGGNDAGVIAHIRQYAKPELKNKLDDIKKISDYEYDWSLNVRR